MIRAIILLFYFYLSFVNPIFAQSKVLINEFQIDPQPQSVEIFNSGTESADISDWIIDDSGGTTFYTIPKDSIVFPNQCLVFSGDFNLNKASSDTIRFINNSQQLIDSFSYRSSSGSGISYYRFPDNNNYWTTGSANLGFYNSDKEQVCLFPTSIPTLIPTIEPTLILTPMITIMPISPTQLCTGQACLTPTTISQSYENIYLSEAMVNPPTGEKEWIEIYNDNDFIVSLNNWFIDDLENTGSSSKIFFLKINAKSYGVLDLTSSMFNNDGDSIRLLDFNKNLKDDFEYINTEQGKTLGRTSFNSDNFCLQEPSKNFVNNSCINPTATISVCTGQACLSPTISKFQSLINQTPTKIPIYINRINSTPVLSYYHSAIFNGTKINLTPPDILGISTKKNYDNSLLINLLSFLSFSYSLLTIISMLFKMRISYGKG